MVKAVKIIRITVDRISEFVRDHLSDRYPKASCPTTVPANAIAPRTDFAFEFFHSAPYWIARMVMTEPMTCHACQLPRGVDCVGV